VAQPTPEDAEARRVYRHELRLVARLLRWSGMALVALGTAGIALGHEGAWFSGPSWASFVIGWALALCGLVRRVERTTDVGPDE
jgi:hypothetical protein